MFWNIYSSLCSSNDTSPSAVAIAIGLSNSIATKWKNGAYPSGDILVKLSEYFNVSVDYLLTGKENYSHQELSEDKQELLDLYNCLSERNQGKLTGYAQSLVNEQNEKAESRKHA